MRGQRIFAVLLSACGGDSGSSSTVNTNATNATMTTTSTGSTSTATSSSSSSGGTSSSTTDPDTGSSGTGMGEGVFIYLGFESTGSFISLGPGVQPRANSDEACVLEQILLGLGCVDAHALASIPLDAISAFPRTYGLPEDVPVISVEGNVVATSFGAMLGSGLDQSLADANVIASGQPFWTGAAEGGGPDVSSCAGWTSELPGQGRTGDPDITDPSFLSADNGSCQETLPVLCLCW